MSSTVTFSDLSGYVYYDIAKYLEFKDQLTQQLVNKTWHDAIKQAFRDYRTVIFEKKISNYRYMNTHIDCGHRSDVFTLRINTQVVQQFINWDPSSNFPGLKTLLIDEFGDVEFKNFPKSIEHLHVYCLSISIMKQIVETKCFTSLRCLSVIIFGTHTIELVKLNRSTI